MVSDFRCFLRELISRKAETTVAHPNGDMERHWAHAYVADGRDIALECRRVLAIFPQVSGTHRSSTPLLLSEKLRHDVGKAHE